MCVVSNIRGQESAIMLCRGIKWWMGACACAVFHLCESVNSSFSNTCRRCQLNTVLLVFMQGWKYRPYIKSHPHRASAETACVTDFYLSCASLWSVLSSMKCCYNGFVRQNGPVLCSVSRKGRYLPGRNSSYDVVSTYECVYSWRRSEKTRQSFQNED